MSSTSCKLGLLFGETGAAWTWYASDRFLCMYWCQRKLFFTGRKYRKIFNTQLFIVEGVSWTKVGRIKEMSTIPNVLAGHCLPAGVELDVNQTKANIHHIPLSSEVVRGSGRNPNGLKGKRRWDFSSIPLPETPNVQTGVDQSIHELIPLSPPKKTPQAWEIFLTERTNQGTGSLVLVFPSTCGKKKAPLFNMRKATDWDILTS